MKKNIFRFLILLIFASCNKNSKLNSIANQIFQEVSPKENSIVFSGERDTIITTKNKIRITFKRGIFKRNDGSSYEGQIVLKIKEIYSPSELLFSGITTMSGNKLLQTGGMIYIYASDSANKALNIHKTDFFTIMFPKATCPNNQMNLYIGKEDSLGNVQWDLIEKALEKKPEISYPVDSIISENQMIEYRKSLDYVIFKSNELGWINCDKELENINNTTLKVNADLQLSPTFRLVFPSINAIAHPKLEDEKFVFYNIPKDHLAILIGYSLVDGKYYFSYREIYIKSNDIIEQKMIVTEKSEIESRVKKISWFRK